MLKKVGHHADPVLSKANFPRSPRKRCSLPCPCPEPLRSPFHTHLSDTAFHLVPETWDYCPAFPQPLQFHRAGEGAGGNSTFLWLVSIEEPFLVFMKPSIIGLKHESSQTRFIVHSVAGDGTILMFIYCKISSCAKFKYVTFI